MDASELQVYEHQLTQVESALGLDPTNAELKNLKEELVNLINLTKTLIGQTASTPSSSSSTSYAGGSTGVKSSGDKVTSRGQDGGKVSSATSSAASNETHSFTTGQDVTAKYSGDGRWYPARIVSIGGAPAHRVYTVVFKGYDNAELHPASDLRPLANHSVSASRPAISKQVDSASTSSASASASKRLSSEEETERDKKRKKNERKSEKQAAKQAAQVDKQVAWQKFAKKGVKKGVIPGNTKSMFKTPEDPHAKVGVVGAGRGMTNYSQRSKHVYEP